MHNTQCKVPAYIILMHKQKKTCQIDNQSEHETNKLYQINILKIKPKEKVLSTLLSLFNS